jgi:hypothetical protein
MVGAYSNLFSPTSTSSSLCIWIFRLCPPSENCFQRFENEVIKQTRTERCFCLHVALYGAVMNKILNIE